MTVAVCLEIELKISGDADMTDSGTNVAVAIGRDIHYGPQVRS